MPSPRKNGPAASNNSTKPLALPNVSQQMLQLAQAGRKTAQQQTEASLELAAGNTERLTRHTMKNFEDMNGMSKEMFDAYVSYCTSWNKGCEEISKVWMNTMQSMTQQWMNCCKTMMTAKTMKEAMDTQGDYVRTQFDTALAETTKLSEMCVKMATEASEPMQAQWNQFVSKCSKAA